VHSRRPLVKLGSTRMRVLALLPLSTSHTGIVGPANRRASINRDRA
jgi:hypothetical protein